MSRSVSGVDLRERRDARREGLGHGEAAGGELVRQVSAQGVEQRAGDGIALRKAPHHLAALDRLRPGEQVTVVANLWDVRERKLGVNRSMVEGILGDSTGTLHAIWWNKWVIRQLETGKSMRFSGKIDLYRGQKTIENPVFEELDDERVATGRMSPIYPLTEGLTNNRLRNVIYDVVDGFARFMSDPLPAQMRDMYDLPDLTYALYQIHFPDSQEILLQARRRLAFEELLYPVSYTHLTLPTSDLV